MSQEIINWDLWKQEQEDLLTIETCNQLLRKQGKCGRLCQTCRDICEELREWQQIGDKK